MSYTARPLAWAAAWAVAAPTAYAITDDARLLLPFPPAGALGAALAIFIAFRNNTAFARWSSSMALFADPDGNVFILHHQ